MWEADDDLGADAAETLSPPHDSPQPNQKLSSAIERIESAYVGDDQPWVVGYSGGKDSTAVLSLLFAALARVRAATKPVTVLHCDTGVDIPCATQLARKALRSFDRQCQDHGLPVSTVTVRPPVAERYFAKVLGRGYPPPTDKFRWCTDRLAINPVSSFLKGNGHSHATVLLGVRRSESAARSLTLKENAQDDPFWSRQKKHSSRRLFMPIVDFSVDDVWDANLAPDAPPSLLGRDLADLYAHASPCPESRRPDGAPCGNARFGCWTCTVAKHGVTLRNLIRSGRTFLGPLLSFRVWIEEERAKARNRWRRRRNGSPGPGPMTMRWRRRALDRLLQAQEESGQKLISKDEIRMIHKLWRRE
jgi:DNA sulfur modification protein DndC